jgi:hypothetical protein
VRGVPAGAVLIVQLAPRLIDSQPMMRNKEKVKSSACVLL